MTKQSNNQTSQAPQSKGSANIVLNALGYDAENITIQTFANLVDLYDSLTVEHVSSPARLMFEKSRLSKMHANEKAQINSSDIVKGVKDAVNELHQYKKGATNEK